MPESPSRYVGNQTSVTSRIISTGPCTLKNILAYNSTGATVYLQIHESATAPADTSVPQFSFPVFSLTGGSLGQAVDMDAVYVCWSSTQATKTLAAASGSIVGVLKA